MEAALLAEEDLLVVSCETTTGAERELAGARPDLLVLWAPSGDPEVLPMLERLREDADGRRVPALVLAAQRRLRAFAAGADDLADPGSSADELRARVRVRLERSPRGSRTSTSSSTAARTGSPRRSATPPRWRASTRRS